MRDEKPDSETQGLILIFGAVVGLAVAAALTAISFGIFGGGQHNAAVFGAGWLAVMYFAARKARVLP